MLVFPDTTVLINFALIQRMDLLERIASGRGKWCATVAAECRRWSSKPGLEGLAVAPDFLGSPLDPTPAEHIDTRTFRLELASPGESNYAHLGEAETLSIMISRGGVGRDLFVTDDDGAARLAMAKGIKAVRTWTLLRLAGKQGWVDAAVLLGYIRLLKSEGRPGAPGELRDTGSVLAWVRSS